MLALPAFGMHTVLTGTDDLPRKLEVMKVYDREQAAFPGGQIPAVVAIEAKDVTTPQIQAATKKMGDRAFATGTMNGPLTVDVSADKHVASISIPMKGDGTDNASANALTALRGGIVDQTVGSAPGVKSAYVTGIAAGTKDFNDLVKAHAPIVFAFVLSLAFLLLLVTFRSIVIPIKAIMLNLLSVGAAYGILTWIFQDGHFQSLLGYKSNGGIVSWLPLFLFVILFGLSMDYHVFILSRIREAFDRGMKTEDAVAYGIKATASTVTSAAIVMVARVRDLRDAELAGLQDDGRRPVGGDPARRDARPRRAAAGHDEAPGRLELVPAQGPALAAAHLPRARPGARSLGARCRGRTRRRRAPRAYQPAGFVHCQTQLGGWAGSAGPGRPSACSAQRIASPSLGISWWSMTSAGQASWSRMLAVSGPGPGRPTCRA